MASMNIDRAFRNERLFKSLTGCSIAEFRELEVGFVRILEDFADNKTRKRAVGGGRKSTINSPATKLFFILFYLKCYPTFDLAGFIFGGVDRAQPCRWVQQLLPVLEAVLGEKAVLPKRKINTIEQFSAAFPEARDLFIDGTERPVQRPGDSKNQKRRYSGKKKDIRAKMQLSVMKTRKSCFSHQQKMAVSTT